MNILGLSGAVGHDASAALFVDGQLVAAVEEERFLRDKHAKGRFPLESSRFCLEYAGMRPADIDVVAFPYSPISLFRAARWHYARRYWYAPDRALDALFNGNRRYKRNVSGVMAMLKQLGLNPRELRFMPVEHHLEVADASLARDLGRSRPSGPVASHAEKPSDKNPDPSVSWALHNEKIIEHSRIVLSHNRYTSC